MHEKLKSLRNHGIIRNKQEQMSKGSWFYDVKSLGYNFRLTDFQCALGISQLKKINRILEYRKKIAIFYDQQLNNNKLVEGYSIVLNEDAPIEATTDALQKILPENWV